MNAENKLINKLSTKVKHHKFFHKDIVLHYKSAGKGHALILLHGATIGWGQWASNIDALSKYFKVFAFDLPGSGKSSKVNFKAEEFDSLFVDPILEFISKKKLQKVNIIGHSTGGLIATKLMLKAKDNINKVVLSNPLGFGKKTPLPFKLLSLPGFANFFTKVLLSNSKKKYKNFYTQDLYNSSSINDDFIDYIYEASLDKGWLGPLHLMSTLTSLKGIKQQFIMLEFFKKNKIPTCVLWGTKDKFFNTQEIKKNIRSLPNFKLIMIKRSGHVPNLEVVDKFNNMSISFLKK